MGKGRISELHGGYRSFKNQFSKRENKPVKMENKTFINFDWYKAKLQWCRRLEGFVQSTKYDRIACFKNQHQKHEFEPGLEHRSLLLVGGKQIINPLNRTNVLLSLTESGIRLQYKLNYLSQSRMVIAYQINMLTVTLWEAPSQMER